VTLTPSVLELLVMTNQSKRGSGMRVSVRQEKDGCWYVIDEKGVRYSQCGRWSTAELAQEEARKFLNSLGYKNCEPQS